MGVRAFVSLRTGDFPSVSQSIRIFQHIDDISSALLNRKLPEQREWKNTSVLFVVTLGMVPVLRISAARKGELKWCFIKLYFVRRVSRHSLWFLGFSLESKIPQ